MSHLLRQPFQIVFGEKSLQRRKRKPCQCQVQRHPLFQRRMLYLDRDLLSCLFHSRAVHLSQRRRADGLSLEIIKEVRYRMAGVLDEHGLNRLERGDGTPVLQRYERSRPLGGKEVIQTAQVLAKLDEDRAVLLAHTQSAFGAALVACFEQGRPLLFALGLVFQRDSIARCTTGKNTVNAVYGGAYSFMHTASVLTSRPVLSAAAYPCFTSSKKANAAAPSVPPPVASNTALLLPLFLAGLAICDTNRCGVVN